MNLSPSILQIQVQFALLRHLKQDFLVIDSTQTLVDLSREDSVFFNHPSPQRGMSSEELLHPEWQTQLSALLERKAAGEPEPLSPRCQFKKGDQRFYGEMQLLRLNDPSFHLVLLKDYTEEIARTTKRDRTLKALMENGMDAVVVLNELGNVDYVSPNITNILGYSPEECSSLNFFDLVHPNDREEVAKGWKNILEHPWELISGNQSRVRNKQGEYRWLEANIINLLHDPEVRGMVDVFRDITDRKEQQEAIRITSERMELVNKATSDAIWDLDLEKKTLFWGDGFGKIFGYSLENNLVDLEFWEGLIHPEDQQRVLDSLNVALEDPELLTWSSEYRFKHATQGYLYVLDKGFMIREENGKAVRMIGAVQDISSLKEAENRLQAERNLMRTIIDNIPDYIFVKDRSGKLIVCNAAQKNLLDELGIDDPDGIKPDEQNVLEQGISVFNKEDTLVPLSGEIRYGLSTKVPFRNESGEIMGLVGISRDITGIRKQADQDRLEARITEAVLVSTDIGAALHQVLEIIGENIQAVCADAWLLNEGKLKLMRTTTWTTNFAPADWSGDQQEEIYLAHHYLGDYWNRCEPAYHSMILKGEPATALIVPVSFNGNCITLLQFYFDSPRQPDQSVLEFCAELGSRMGVDIKTKKNELELAMFFTHGPDPLCIASANGFFKKVNPAFLQLFGYDETYATTNPVLSFVHPDDLEATLSTMELAFSGQRINGYECRLKTASGNWVWMTWDSSELFYQEGLIFVYGKDITGLKEAERNLVMFKKVLDSSRDGVAIYNPETKKSYLNQSLQEMMGYNISEIDQMGSPALTYVDEKQGWEMFDTILSGEFFKGEVQLLTKDNKVLDLELSAGPIFDEDGNVEAVYGIHSDISERKKYMAALLEMNERYNLVARATNDVIWDWNLLTNEVIRTGNGLENLTGNDNSDRIDFWLNRVHPMDLDGVISRREALLKDPSASIWEDEYRFLKANGEMAHVQDKGYIMRNEQGVAVRVIGATQDITHRKEFLNELLRVKQNLDALINNTEDMIWSFNNKMQLIVANEAFIEKFAPFINGQVQEGIPLLSAELPAYIIEKWTPLYERALSGEAFTVEQYYGRERPYEDQYYMVSFTPFRNEKEEVAGAACFARNITEQKKAYKKLEELNMELLKQAGELAASNADLERFAFIASHDLQEPLRMVTSFLQLLKQRYYGQLDEKADTYIDFAVDGASRMKQLIHGLLDYARVGNSTADAVPVDLNLVMRDVQILLKAKIEETNAVIVAEPLPVVPKANYTQMLQLLQNLLGNALKYKREADPLIQVAVQDEGDYWTISVLDNGMGLDMRYADKVFQVFQRLHANKTFSGTGIGLSICKRIVEKMGGRIWVESEPGKGSCFYFTILK